MFSVYWACLLKVFWAYCLLYNVHAFRFSLYQFSTFLANTNQSSQSRASNDHGGEDHETHHAASIKTFSINPPIKDLRLTCDPCRLLHRTCRNGSPATPCDRCVERNVTCVFNPYGTFIEQRKRKRKGKSTAEEESQAESNKKIRRNPTVAAPGFDPTALGLRRRCNFCHLRVRACVNGSDTTPCDNCKRMNLICTFGVRKSIVDKNSLIKVADEDYIEQHNNITAGRPGDIMDQHYLEDEAAEDVNPQFYMSLGGQYLLFNQEQIYLEEDYTMHPCETLTARQTLGYQMMGVQEGGITAKMEEE